jgi:hypothetical protein
MPSAATTRALWSRTGAAMVEMLASKKPSLTA